MPICLNPPLQRRDPNYWRAGSNLSKRATQQRLNAHQSYDIQQQQY